MNLQDTICAIATGQGGAVAIIRLSGSESLRYTQKIFFPLPKNWHSKHTYFGTLQIDEEPLDEVLVTYHQAPHSYTGEDIVEIACHASPYIQRTLLQSLVKEGARLAEPGEFTMRSFIKGKRDLAEAEAVADLIAAQSQTQHQVALRQLQGSLSRELDKLQEKLLHFATLLELELDFSEEDVEFANREELSALSDGLIQHLSTMLHSYQKGKQITQGVPIAIVGVPNTGKSTLLNALLQEDRALVSHIEGTTRDTIEEHLLLEGVLFRLIDTAGIRITEDPIEQMGIDRSFQKAQNAALVLLIVDAQKLYNGDFSSIKGIESLSVAPSKTLLLLNKIDAIPTDAVHPLIDTIEKQLRSSSIFAAASESNDGMDTPLRSASIFTAASDSNLGVDTPLILPISAKTGSGLDQLPQEILERSGAVLLQNETLLTNERHKAALEEALHYLTLVQKNLREGISADFVSLDLRAVLQAIGSITGETISSESVLHSVFAHFCIGK